mmetsp:Transcript_3367/g.6997  ORF Transcript_3367/g.6997 Transcript_3367/m.6997 type:complete len:480 (-) Transcript_3367:88-1527(-)|eukprot:CAMPEP_0118934146 /NCGR_PEP_ID=MMETSP1169-20130426/13662_1 /TAXON_ID=36882 /ORGANISM="Pyramimonas obovata, Strain CCMP722" /LENGTH=479 /DNA_ID=CAMNT_0006877017 /DNA_START=197 /DNA_END=1636 /DNA_ORIENTATION=-
MKRGREEGEDEPAVPPVKVDDDDDDDKPVGIRYRSVSTVRPGYECPYMDTICRQLLDFDFEKCCSVSLSPINVYACLVCGKYFQGRGPTSHASTHSLEFSHHVFMKVETGKVYCLPDGYEVDDRSVDDVRHVLNPKFTEKELQEIDKNTSWSRSLDGIDYLPGLIGLNNMKMNDYANVIIQALTRVIPIRDYFLNPVNYQNSKSVIVQRFGELLRKIWNPRNFKGQVSPHEFMQAVMAHSKKKFTIEKQADPVEFMSWMLNTLHFEMTGGKVKRRSVIHDNLQGEIEVTTEKGTGKAKEAGADLVERVPFLMLGLDLPPAPLYKDSMEKNIIPQVQLYLILQKFDNVLVNDNIKLGRRRFRLTKLPRYLILHVKRFTKNNFFVEKNPTIVNFPIKNLELRDVIPCPVKKDGSPVPSKYNLVANMCHEGKPGAGTYKVHIHRKSEDMWYEVQDLNLVDILPQQVVLSETYMQIYELQQES